MTKKPIFEQLSGDPHLGLQSLESAVVLPGTFLLMFPRTAEHRRKVTVSRDTQFTLHFSNPPLNNSPVTWIHSRFWGNTVLPTCAILVFFCWNWQSLRMRTPDSSWNCWWKGWRSCTCSPKLEHKQVGVTVKHMQTDTNWSLFSLCGGARFVLPVHRHPANFQHR